MKWSINGRFLGQSRTGVQRYASEIVLALDRITSKEAFEIIAPYGVTAMPELKNIDLRKAGKGDGHIWEQGSLPFVAKDGLLSLCNTGPVCFQNQVVCMHDANVWMFSSSYSLAFRSFYKVLLPTLGRRARKVLTVSSASADALIEFGIAPARKIEIVSNGHEHIYRWDASRSALLPQLLELKRPFVFAVGSRAPHKNLNLLLAIAPRLDELGIDLFISGGHANIFSSSAEMPQGRNVRMLGFVADDDLAALYTRALCLTFPSFVEGFGLPLVEAMAFGCPIVSSNTSCMPEICGDYAHYANPKDPSAWADAIEALKFADRRNLNGSSQLAKFRWNQSAEILKAVVDEV